MWEELRYWSPEDSKYDQPVTWLLACVVGTLGNADMLATKVSHPCLVSLAAGNILAMLCLPLNYLHHFSHSWHLGHITCRLFWLARDTAVGVQMFSVVALATCRTSWCGIWGAAVTCAVCKTLLWAPRCCLRAEDMLEDLATKNSVVLHCVVMCGLPLLLSAALQRDRTSFWLTVVLAVNYLPLYCWMLLAWTRHLFITTIFVDFATYFPLYSAAGWIPVAVYFLLSADDARNDVFVTSHPFVKQDAGAKTLRTSVVCET